MGQQARLDHDHPFVRSILANRFHQKNPYHQGSCPQGQGEDPLNPFHPWVLQDHFCLGRQVVQSILSCERDEQFGCETFTISTSATRLSDLLKFSVLVQSSKSILLLPIWAFLTHTTFYIEVYFGHFLEKIRLVLLQHLVTLISTLINIIWA